MFHTPGTQMPHVVRHTVHRTRDCVKGPGLGLLCNYRIGDKAYHDVIYDKAESEKWQVSVTKHAQSPGLFL